MTPEAAKPDTERTRRWFRLKLERLESIVLAKQAGQHVRTWYPLSLKEFREWTSPGEFGAWVSQSIDAPNGTHPDLAKRLAELMKSLKTNPILERNVTLQHLNAVLIKQNLLLEVKIQQLRDQIVLLGGSSNESAVLSIYVDCVHENKQ